MSKPKEVKGVLIEDKSIARPTTLAIFLLQTIENEDPPEDAGACVRIFKCKTHADMLLADKVQYTILGWGDSNMLLDRQHTGAVDFNQMCRQCMRGWKLWVGQDLLVGGVEYQTSPTKVEPWMEALIAKLKV